MNRKAPVILFVYNRLEHTMQTVEALHKNIGSEETELFVFADGAKDRTEKANVEAVRKYLWEIEDKNWFAHMVVYAQESNHGLEKSIISGVNQIINQYGRVIVLEDDIITAPDFLMFMNKALDAFEKDRRVWSISTYLPENKKIGKSKNDILWTYRGECWGWASWANRWNRVDWEVSDYEEFNKDRKKQRKFNRGGRDLSFLLQLQQRGEISSWAIKWCYQQYKENMIAVFPKFPKSYNIGLDGSGTNCSERASNIPDFKQENAWSFQYSLRDKTLLREFQKKYFINYWRQRLGSCWYALAREEHCLAYGKEGMPHQCIKAGCIYDYTRPILCEIKGQKYLFVTVINTVTAKKNIGVFALQKQINRKPVILLKWKSSLILSGVFQLKGTWFLTIYDNLERQVHFYQMKQNIYQWQKYGMLKIEEELSDVIVIHKDNRIYLAGSTVKREKSNKAVLVHYEIIDFLKPQKMKTEFLWKEDSNSCHFVYGGSWFVKNEKLYRTFVKSTSKQGKKTIAIEKIVNMDDRGIESELAGEVVVNSENILLMPFIYQKLGISGFTYLNEDEVIEIYVKHFSLGRLVVKCWQKLQIKYQKCMGIKYV